LVGELIRRVDGRSVGTYFKEELAEPLDLDFKIGLDDADFGRCADMLMLEKLPSISQLNILKYVPDFALSNGLRNIKLAVKSGYNPIAFDNRALADNPNFANTAEWR
jgi:CubicO group peptidase (beta-lactamase class C family)